MSTPAGARSTATNCCTCWRSTVWRATPACPAAGAGRRGRHPDDQPGGGTGAAAWFRLRARQGGRPPRAGRAGNGGGWILAAKVRATLLALPAQHGRRPPASAAGLCYMQGARWRALPGGVPLLPQGADQRAPAAGQDWQANARPDRRHGCRQAELARARAALIRQRHRAAAGVMVEAVDGELAPALCRAAGPAVVFG